MVGEFVFCHLNDLETPREGEVLTDRWWTVMPGKGAAFYRRTSRGHLSPQCNRSRQIAESLQKDLIPEAMVVHVPVAFVGHNYQCGGKIVV